MLNYVCTLDQVSELALRFVHGNQPVHNEDIIHCTNRNSSSFRFSRDKVSNLMEVILNIYPLAGFSRSGWEMHYVPGSNQTYPVFGRLPQDGSKVFFMHVKLDRTFVIKCRKKYGGAVVRLI